MRMQRPHGWTKWVIPDYEYIYVEHENDNTFSEVIQYLKDNGIALVGAVHDLGNQLHKKDSGRCYGIFADEKYLTVSEYSGYGTAGEIGKFLILYIGVA